MCYELSSSYLIKNVLDKTICLCICSLVYTMSTVTMKTGNEMLTSIHTF